MKSFLLGMIALTAPVAAQAPAKIAIRSVQVTMTDHGFVPRNVVIRRGASYVLTVTNKSGKGHNLTQEAFFRAARVAPRDQGRIDGGKIVLAAGERTSIRFHAPLTRRGGTYQFSSTVLADADDDYRGRFLIR